MKTGEAQDALKTILSSIYENGEASVITDRVMEHVTGKTKMQRLAEKDLLLDEKILKQITAAAAGLMQNRPVQYVLGEAWFMGLRFTVNEAVLIPRPETEELVTWAVEIMNDVPGSILDIGTGSGCIPVILKKKLPLAEILSVDISGDALDVARENAKKNTVNVSFKQLDFLEEKNWDQLSSFDLIISNPPYIPVGEKAELDAHVTAFEPGAALFVPDETPLIFYEKIALFGQTHLKPGGKILVELHQQFGPKTENIFKNTGYHTVLRKDIFENDRMLLASF